MGSRVALEVGRGSCVLGSNDADPGSHGLEALDDPLVDLSLSIPPTPLHEPERQVIEAGFQALAGRSTLAELLRNQPLAGMRRHRAAERT